MTFPIISSLFRVSKKMRQISGLSLKILPDYYCLLAFECQDLRRNTATKECTAHCLPISLLYRAFVNRWDRGVVLELLVVFLMYRSKPMNGQ